MNQIEQLIQESKDIEARQKELTEQIAKLQQEDHAPWEPKPGKYFIDLSGKCAESLSEQENHHGGRFQTKEAAERGAKFFEFYQRLYQLAIECNAKYEESSAYRFGPRLLNNKWVIGSQDHSSKYPTQIFTSRASLHDALEIMNRDGWKLPQ